LKTRVELDGVGLVAEEAMVPDRGRTSARPVFQVVSTVNTTTPASSGNHPPSGIFRMLAPKKPRSTIRNSPTTAKALGRLQPRRSIANNPNKRAVITMVAVTATP
jgi:hypothetical protein